MKTNIPSLLPPILIPARRALAPLAALLLAGTLSGVPEALAGTTQMGFMPPAVHVVTTFYDFDPPVHVVAHDLALFWPCSPLGFARLFNNAGLAAARAGKDHDHWAVASATDMGGTYAEAATFVRVTDPQDRPTVKLDLKFKALTFSGSEPVGTPPRTTASWRLAIGSFSRTPLKAVVFDDLCTVQSAEYTSDVLMRPTVLDVVGGDAKYIDLNGDLQTEAHERIYSYGEQIFEGGPGSAPRTLTLEVNTLLGVAMIISADATFGGIAVIDPVITPHPDNPDVIVELRASDEPTERRPFDGISAEDLAARGIDPQPFIDLGFLDTPPPGAGDTTPPTTVASPTPGPNANGWNNGAVTVNLTATDEAGGSVVKEIHVALSGATVGSQVISGSSAPVQISAEGETTLTYFAVDHAGNAEEAKTQTVRIDVTPPVLAGLPAAGCALWPPNHRPVRVATVTASDALSGLATGAPTVTATSNEPEVGAGAGDLAPDVAISAGVVQVRAERAGTGLGRVYTITASAADRAGNLASATATCIVPHDRAGGG